jgi:hypothetical protein
MIESNRIRSLSLIRAAEVKSGTAVGGVTVEQRRSLPHPTASHRPQEWLQLQTTRDSYCLVAGFKTWRCVHWEPPTGGACIGGEIDGGVIWQTDKGQAGGISVLVVHRGTRRPSTHWQTHFASAARVGKKLATTTKVSRILVI